MNPIVSTLAQQGDQQTTLVGTVLELLIRGGWVMVPLGLCSLAALAIVVERLVVTRRSRVAPPGFSQSLAGLGGGKHENLDQ
jgi:biopolymer transport protein ExbB/TolQ